MQNEQSAKHGARVHHRGDKDEVLSPVEAAAIERGQTLKRYVRAAAAMNDLYDDASLGDAVSVSRGTVAGWWRGAKPSGDTIFRLARATGLSPDELTRYVYSDGPPPGLPLAGSPVVTSVQEGLLRDQERQEREGPDTLGPSQTPRTHDSGAGRG